MIPQAKKNGNASTSVGSLNKFIKKMDKKINVLTDVEYMEKRSEWMESNQPPVFLFQGISLTDVRSPVIFVTLFGEPSSKAFRINANESLFKPLKKITLSRVLEKFINHKTKLLEPKDHIPTYHRSQQHFLIKGSKEYFRIEMNDVAYFHTKSKINFLVTKKGRRFPIEKSLTEINEIINPKCFFRINRQYIIHEKSIKEMHKHSGSRMKLILDPAPPTETIVSTERTPLFKKWLVGELQ